MTGEKLTSGEEWKKFWPLVLVAAVGFSFHSIMSASTGIFMEPLGKEFGWNKSMQTSGLTIAALVGMLLSPFFGILIDKHGTRKLALPGLVLSGLCVTAFGYATGSVTQWIVMWSFYALASLAIKSTIWTSAVSGVFDKGRGLAIGVALSGTAVAMTIAPPLVNSLVENFGWRNAFAWLGLGWGGLTLILCYFLLYDAHDLKLRPMHESVDGKRAETSLPGLSVAQAWRSSALWRIGISTFLMMVITIALNVHQYPIMTEAGVDRTSAAWFASLAGFSGIIGKLVTGWLLDRYRPNWIGGVTLAMTAGAFILLMMPNLTTPMIVTAMVVNGYAAGTKLQICGLLTSRYGGIKNFGKIFGMMATMIAAGSAIGPFFASAVYDFYGNYIPFLWSGVAASLVCGLLIFGLPLPPEFED